MTRKFLALLLAMVMLLSFAACDITWPDLPFFGSDPTEPSDPTDPAPTDPAPTDPAPTDPAPTDPAPTDPTPTEPAGNDVYLGLTDSHLDAIGKVTADIFDAQMNGGWNFGWEGDATLEHNATKFDFDFDAADSEVTWRLGGYGAEGSVLHINGGWCTGLWAKGEGNVSYMYNKLDIPEYATQFRVWAVSRTDNHWSGSGAVRAVALYKDADGNYVKHVFVPKAETFTEGSTAFYNEEKGTVEFSNAIENMPGVPDGMIIYDIGELAGKEDVTIVVESVGLGTILGDEFTEAAEGVPAGEAMPECVLVKRVIFIVEPPAPPVDPEATQPVTPEIPVDQEVYNGMTGTALDALATIEGAEFGTYMNETWNFGWHGATPDVTATKVDFAGTAADSKIWHLGAVGTAGHGNAGWGVQLAPTGVGSNAYMYAKLDVPAEGITQFRIWTAILENLDPAANWSGKGAVRAVACYKNENGNYIRQTLVPVGEAASMFNAEDGTTRITAAGDWTVTGISDGMIIYDLGGLAGKEDVTIFVEALGITEGMTDHFIVKRIMFLG